MTTFIDPYSTSTENGNSHALHHERHDELGSQSGSDEGSTAHYPDSFRDNVDFDDDSDALTSQTLNADGTPKRPMNAFMIFARRRRPQVSAENQAMRTGEISKILSKEWAIMPPSEKQFYLDRAKQLKENFNSKYPDYVYRRRPNNSRKKSKRRLDTGMGGPLDHRNTPEGPDDFGISGDYDPHHDVEDRHYDGVPGVLQSRLHHDYIGATQARPNPFAYVPSDPPYRHESSHDPRVPFLPSQAERLSNDAPGTPHRATHPELYSYMSSGQSQPYSTSSGETHDRWESRVGPGRAGWMHERPIPAPSDRFATGGSAGWSGAVPPGSAAQTGSSAQPGNFTFPTLTSPFYPNQGHLQNYQATAPPSSHPSSPARYGSPAQGPQNTSRDYSTQGYHPTPSVAAESPFSGNSVMYQPRTPRGLPSVQTITSYSPLHPGASGTTASQGY